MIRLYFSRTVILLDGATHDTISTSRISMDNNGTVHHTSRSGEFDGGLFFSKGNATRIDGIEAS